jgi:hypothetical protein
MNGKFLGGHVEYSFEMYVDHRESIRCKIDDFRINEIVISKLVPDDPFDYKWKLVIFCQEVSSIEEVDSIGDENKENFFNLISFILNTGVYNTRKTGHGLIPREGEGVQGHMIIPTMTCNGVGRSGGRKLNAEEIHELGEIIAYSKKINNNPLVNIFSYASRVADPIVQFMFFYLILYEIYDEQRLIDKFIMKIFPNTVRNSSPHNNKQETIFTRLRNEINHRVNRSPEETKNDIICNVNKLKHVAHAAIVSQIAMKK